MDGSDESSVIRTILRIGPDRPFCTADTTAPGHDGVDVGGREIVAMDTLVEGVHFDHGSSPADVGFKAVAVNASDIGAMGARPTWALLSLALPRVERAWIEGFAEGLWAALDHWSIRLLGGDTVRSPGAVVVTLSMAGRAHGSVPGRGGAKPGDDLWVTGRLGRGSAGFHGVGDREWLRRPRPPVELGAALAEGDLVTAMMDLSDGLATDLPRLCAASGVGALVDPDSLPIAEGLDGRADALDHAVAFGDDYELLFAAAPSHRAAIERLAPEHGTTATRVGQVTASRSVLLDGRAWPMPRFAHFGAPS